MVLAGFCASLESDFKKVIAMSTLSQLGLMMFRLGFGLWKLSFLHVVLHALFKSMLFLSCGSLMVQLGGGQDSRFYGSFFYSSVKMFFLVSCLSLCGFPFVVGFYSKDYILGSLGFYSSLVVFFCFFVGCLLTVSYSFRFLYEGFFRCWSFSPHICIYDSLSCFLFVFCLFFWSCFMGGVIGWLFLSFGPLFIRGFDYLIGFYVIFVGLFFWFSFFFSYFFVSFFSGLGFLGWLSSGGLSSLNFFLDFFKVDLLWIESFGASGLYSFFSSVGYFFSFFYGFSYKIILGGSLFLIFFLLWFFSLMNLALKELGNFAFVFLTLKVLCFI